MCISVVVLLSVYLHRIGWIIGRAYFICSALRFVESRALSLLSLDVALATSFGETGTGGFLFLFNTLLIISNSCTFCVP